MQKIKSQSVFKCSCCEREIERDGVAYLDNPLCDDCNETNRSECE